MVYNYCGARNRRCIVKRSSEPLAHFHGLRVVMSILTCPLPSPLQAGKDPFSKIACAIPSSERFRVVSTIESREESCMTICVVRLKYEIWRNCGNKIYENYALLWHIFFSSILVREMVLLSYYCKYLNSRTWDHFTYGNRRKRYLPFVQFK